MDSRYDLACAGGVCSMQLDRRAETKNKLEAKETPKASRGAVWGMGVSSPSDYPWVWGSS